MSYKFGYTQGMALKRILVVYTGGTFGMRSVPKTKHLEIPQLNAAQLKEWLKSQVPEMMKIATCDVDVLFNLDSCQFQAHHWFELAAHLHDKLQKNKYDGVVVLHGTDTLAYTAAALSYLLSPCPVPVVITGAQKPLATLRNDARTNFISALEVAAHAPAPLRNRVMVVFHDEVFLGSRARKKSAIDFAAFESPRFPKLASIGSDITYHEVIHQLPPLSRKKNLLTLFKPQANQISTPQILTTPVTPEFCGRIFTTEFLKNIDGVLLTLYASGTAPTQQAAFLKFLERSELTHTPVLTITERENEVKSLQTYASGRELVKQKVIWCRDLTPEAAFVKFWILRELHSSLNREMYYRWIQKNWNSPLADETNFNLVE